jgi:hypothetical protein
LGFVPAKWQEMILRLGICSCQMAGTKKLAAVDIMYENSEKMLSFALLKQ